MIEGANVCKTCNGTCEIRRPARTRRVAVVDRDTEGRKIGIGYVSETSYPASYDACPDCAREAEIEYRSLFPGWPEYQQ